MTDKTGMFESERERRMAEIVAAYWWRGTSIWEGALAWMESVHEYHNRQ